MSIALPDFTAVISAAAAVISAIATVFATKAANKSAESANSANKHLRDATLGALHRDVMKAANSILSETLSVDYLVTEIQREAKSLAVFRGTAGGSGEIKLNERLRLQWERVGPAQEAARSALDSRGTLDDTSFSNMTLKAAEFEGMLVHVQRVKSQLQEMLASLREELRPYREAVALQPSIQEIPPRGFGV